jgi:hypothetical protein
MNKTTKIEQGGGRGEALEQTEALFKRWREARKRGARIPNALWACAVGLVGRYGVERIAQQLRVDERRLRKHARRAGGVAPSGKGEPPFIELLSGSTPPARTGNAECVVELENARGGKMRVELSGQGLGGLASLCDAFWGAP